MLLRDELHAHLYGCLSADDVFDLGKDVWRERQDRLTWYATEYERAWGRRPLWEKYWAATSGRDLLAHDYEFLAPASFARFQACFNLTIALFPAMTDAGRVLEHVLRRQRESGLRYGEYRCFVPQVLTRDEIRTYLSALAEVTTRIERESGAAFTPRLLMSLSRETAILSEQYAALRQTMNADAEVVRAVVGIDFCGVEEGFPPRRLRAALATILGDNQRQPESALAVCYHVGEAFDGMSLMSAARWVAEAAAMGVHRLGHAIALGLPPRALPEDRNEHEVTEPASERRDHLRWLLGREEMLRRHGYTFDRAQVAAELSRVEELPPDTVVRHEYNQETLDDAERLQEALLAELATSGAIIESCPSSNLRIGRIPAARHPLPRFLAKNLRVVIGADDPGIFASELKDEERLLRHTWGLDDFVIQRLAQTAERARAARLAGRSEDGPGDGPGGAHEVGRS